MSANVETSNWPLPPNGVRFITPPPLRRLLAHTVETALSKKIKKGEIKEGDTVQIGIAGNELTFTAQ